MFTKFGREENPKFTKIQLFIDLPKEIPPFTFIPPKKEGEKKKTEKVIISGLSSKDQKHIHTERIKQFNLIYPKERYEKYFIS